MENKTEIVERTSICNFVRFADDSITRTEGGNSSLYVFDTDPSSSTEYDRNTSKNARGLYKVSRGTIDASVCQPGPNGICKCKHECALYEEKQVMEFEGEALNEATRNASERRSRRLGSEAHPPSMDESMRRRDVLKQNVKRVIGRPSS